MSEAVAEASPFDHPLLRRFLAVSALALGAVNATKVVVALGEPYLWLKDLRQDWLQAQAIAAGLPAYSNLPDLAERFIGAGHPPEFPMATPHPPFAALLCMPMAWVSYPVAAAAWAVGGVLALITAGWWLYGAWMGSEARRVGPFALAALAAFSWHPVVDDLVLGQFSLLLNLLFVAAWLALRDGRDGAGGVALGAALALKLAGWPIVGWLVLERRWKAVGAAIATTAALHAASLPAVGVGGVVRYYTEVGAQASAIYSGHERDLSMIGLGVRLFSGSGSPAMRGLEAPPLVDAPALAGPVGVLALLALGIATVIGARRATGSSERRFDAGFALFACASVVANPVAWSVYLTMAMVPLWVAAREWRRAADPPLIFGALVALALVLPPQTLATFFDVVAPDGRAPFLVSLVSLTHLAGLLGLGALIVRLSSATPRAA